MKKQPRAYIITTPLMILNFKILKGKAWDRYNEILEKIEKTKGKCLENKDFTIPFKIDHFLWHELRITKENIIHQELGELYLGLNGYWTHFRRENGIESVARKSKSNYYFDMKDLREITRAYLKRVNSPYFALTYPRAEKRVSSVFTNLGCQTTYLGNINQIHNA